MDEWKHNTQNVLNYKIIILILEQMQSVVEKQNMFTQTQL